MDDKSGQGRLFPRLVVGWTWLVLVLVVPVLLGTFWLRFAPVRGSPFSYCLHGCPSCALRRYIYVVGEVLR